MTRALIVLFALLPGIALTQDYVMYETQYLKVRPGHTQQFNAAMKAHNDRFHASGPYQATVWYVSAGPHSGQMFWAMGPCTFTDLDNRPSSAEHQSDWADNVLANAEQGEIEYWRMDAEISHNPDNANPPPLLRVRNFDIYEGQEHRFEEQQRKIKEMLVAKNRTTSRSLFRTVLASGTGRDYAVSTSFENWAGLDSAGTFVKDYEDVHGTGSFARFVHDRAEIVKHDQDEFHELIPELSGESTTSND